jgi:hypothetical protein
MSSFKCGHDAPIYTVIEQIIEKSGTPYFSFKDIDENKPTGSIRIRVETIHYFLKRYAEDLIRKRQHASDDVAAALARYEHELRRQFEMLEQISTGDEQARLGRKMLPLIPMTADGDRSHACTH